MEPGGSPQLDPIRDLDPADGGGIPSDGSLQQVRTDASWQDKVILSGPPGTVFPAFVDLHFHTQGIITFSGMGTGSVPGPTGGYVLVRKAKAPH